MIINHKYKFIFIKTQKTAGTSLEITLSALCTSKDIITPISIEDEKIRKEFGSQGPCNYKNYYRLFNKKNFLEYLFKSKKMFFYNHISCLEVKNIIGNEMFDNYYKFCFERNPYDKVISLFYHQGGFNKWDSIEDFIKKGGLNIIKGFDQYTIGKIVAVDDIFKFEDLEDALVSISNTLKLSESLKMPELKLKSKFRKDKRHYSEVLTQNEKKLIDIIWAREKELLNYHF
ncbi:MAG: sulfotransferase family 2 domain-containing protein [Flavobacteriaceae bacterium]